MTKNIIKKQDKKDKQVAKQSIVVDTVNDNFALLMQAYEENETLANAQRVIAYDSDLLSHNERELQLSIEQRICSAQRKRNMQAMTDTTTKFCRLLKTTEQVQKQNYRIDKALEDFHTMNELMSITKCSESRIKSHINFIKKEAFTHCRFEIDSKNDKRFRFVLTTN